MSALETARDQSLLMPSRWGLRDAPKVLDFAGGLSATFLSAQPGEVCSPPTEAHIVSLVTIGERHHRMWRDGKVITDGTLPSSSVNIVAAGIAPRAVISDPIDVLHVYVPAARLKNEAERAGGLGAGNFEIVDPLYRPDTSLTAVLGAIARSIAGEDWTDGLWLDSLGATVTARMLQRWSTLARDAGGRPAPARGGLAPWQLRRVTDRLLDDLPCEPSLAELAALTGLSEHHFCRSFVRSTGTPPHRWLLNQRVARAQQLLSSSLLTVAEIAASVGYEDPSYFARLFKRHTGVTPLTYRKERLS